MNTRQVIDRMRNHLIARRWRGDPSGEPVFAPFSVKPSPGPISPDLMAKVQMPASFLWPDVGSSDPDGQGEIRTLFTQRIRVGLIVQNSGDAWGEFALVGARHTSHLSGDGRGLLEVEEELYDVMEALARLTGLKIQSRSQGIALPVTVGDDITALSRLYDFDVDVGTRSVHLEPRNAAVAVAGPTATVSWDAPWSTTDLVEYRVRRVPGTVPTADPAGGTEVALASPLDLSVDDTPGAPGDYTYSVFGFYADPGGAIALHGSDFTCASGTVT